MLKFYMLDQIVFFYFLTIEYYLFGKFLCGLCSSSQFPVYSLFTASSSHSLLGTITASLVSYHLHEPSSAATYRVKVQTSTNHAH